MGGIREARLSDTTRLQEILESSIRHSLRDYYDNEEIDALTQCYEPMYRSMIMTVGFNIIVSESNNKVDAFCAFDIGNSIIESLFVCPSSMKSGIGRELLRKSESQLKSMENSGVCVFSSLNATGFYSKCEYQEYERTNIDMLDGTGVPSILMYKDFSETDGLYDIKEEVADLYSWN